MNTRNIERVAVMRGLIALCSTFGIVACSGSPTPVLGCEAADGITPDCRFQNPEDLAPIGNGFLVSQMAKGETAGSLVYYDVDDSSIDMLFPHAAVDVPADRWGDAACTPPDIAKFGPHGIDLEQRADGKTALYVVNHGGREAVEVFEVLNDGGAVSLSWRGCVEGPERANFNDVVGLNDGGVWATQQFDQPGAWSVIKGMLFGADTGYVYEWRPSSGWNKLEGTDASFPNGITKAPDESVVYVNSYFGNAIDKIDVASGKLLGTAHVETPDNVTWSSDGRLLVASHTDSFMELFACREVVTGSCGFAFEIVAVDPATMQTMPVLAHRGAPMGAATVAAERNGELFLGTFAGDRISRFRWRE